MISPTAALLLALDALLALAADDGRGWVCGSCAALRPPGSTCAACGASACSPVQLDVTALLSTA